MSLDISVLYLCEYVSKPQACSPEKHLGGKLGIKPLRQDLTPSLEAANVCKVELTLENFRHVLLLCVSKVQETGPELACLQSSGCREGRYHPTEWLMNLGSLHTLSTCNSSPAKTDENPALEERSLQWDSQSLDLIPVTSLSGDARTAEGKKSDGSWAP